MTHNEGEIREEEAWSGTRPFSVEGTSGAWDPGEASAELMQQPDDEETLLEAGRAREVTCRALIEKGTSALENANYSAAEATLTRALELARGIKPETVMVDVLRALLKCAFLTRNSDTALLRGMQALQLSRECGDPTREAQVLNDLGLIFGNLGEFEGALEHFLAGLKILRTNGSSPTASLLNNVGNIYVELGDNREALSFFRSALDAFRGERSSRGQAVALGNIGRAQAALGSHLDALTSFEESLRLYEQLRDNAYRLPAEARLASGLAALGRDDEARQLFQRVLTAVEETGCPEFEDEILVAAGKFYLSRSEVRIAIQLFERALALFPPGETTRRVFDTRLALSEAYEILGDHLISLVHFKEYHRARDAAASAALTVRIRRLMLQFDVGRARQQEEIFRLRNVELAQANQKLQELKDTLESKNRELHQITIEDSLSGLHNRRYLDLQLGIEVSRAHRYSRPLCAAMCDIDHFKSVNDRFSHVVGDEVIRRIAGILRDVGRNTDLIIRYGGEEFLLILPDTELAGAEVVTERIRKRVSGYEWAELAEGLQITLSIGVAELGITQDGAALIASADARLYDAKRSGRDRVVA